MKIYTIGFTKSSAEHFFARLMNSKAARLVDVRLNNVSQLAGFAKRDDLRFFAHELCGIEYGHNLALAPTRQMLADHRNNHGEWDAYAARFRELMEQRRIEEIPGSAGRRVPAVQRRQTSSLSSPPHCLVLAR